MRRYGFHGTSHRFVSLAAAEYLGKKPEELKINEERAKYWVATGAQPTDTTRALLKKGGIIVNEDGLTSRDAVYAGGDAVTGAATVISAMGAGKLAAKSIDEFLSNK